MHKFGGKSLSLKTANRCKAKDHNIGRSSWLLVQCCFLRYLTTNSYTFKKYVTRRRLKCFVELFISMQNLVLNRESCSLRRILLSHTRNNEWMILLLSLFWDDVNINSDLSFCLSLSFSLPVPLPPSLSLSLINHSKHTNSNHLSNIEFNIFAHAI